VSPEYKGKLGGKTVIVFDDFTTSGMSLDWARTLLLSAGAERVILVTFGKYAKIHPAKHHCYVPQGLQINPFALRQYEHAHFRCLNLDMQSNDPGHAMTVDMFQHWQQKLPYPRK
jgi:hypothetical protein